ncbi:hypothetical protein TTRE_0000451501 [Trichuris trichiura]|uniref:Uncharacterized protein n=1 Tax=Trichuris trichiura TaxID=36087 RepID=A0A077ZCB6_TRITR|nr:hypothetical protein TTRE_0000451501 [Trichuris trichiura]
MRVSELITPVLSTVELLNGAKASNNSASTSTASEAALAVDSVYGTTDATFGTDGSDRPTLHHVSSSNASSTSALFSPGRVEQPMTTFKPAEKQGQPVADREPAKASSNPAVPWVFPRTSVIAGVSLALIIAVIAIVFYVFKCRRDSSASDSSEYKSITADAYDEKNSRSALLSGCFSNDTAGLRYGVDESTEVKNVKEWYV